MWFLLLLLLFFSCIFSRLFSHISFPSQKWDDVNFPMSVGKVANRNASRSNQEWEKAVRQIECKHVNEWERAYYHIIQLLAGWLVDRSSGVLYICSHSIIILFLVLIIMIKTDYGSHLECYGLVRFTSSFSPSLSSMHLFFLLLQRHSERERVSKWQPSSNLIFGWLWVHIC